MRVKTQVGKRKVARSRGDRKGGQDTNGYLVGHYISVIEVDSKSSVLARNLRVSSVSRAVIGMSSNSSSIALRAITEIYARMKMHNEMPMIVQNSAILSAVRPRPRALALDA